MGFGNAACTHLSRKSPPKIPVWGKSAQGFELFLVQQYNWRWHWEKYKCFLGYAKTNTLKLSLSNLSLSPIPCPSFLPLQSFPQIKQRSLQLNCRPTWSRSGINVVTASAAMNSKPALNPEGSNGPQERERFGYFLGGSEAFPGAWMSLVEALEGRNCI